MNNGSNNLKWTVAATLLALGMGFIGSYSFLSNAFISRAEFAIVREEQARRTPLVFGQTAKLEEIDKRLARIELDLAFVKEKLLRSKWPVNP